METTTRLLLPVGHLLGAIHYGDSTDSTRFTVRVGRQDVDLTLPEFVVWSGAHGVPEKVAGQPWTAEDTYQAALDTGVEDVPATMDQLRSKDLLDEVTPGTGDALRFAAGHQAFPLLLGLGNSLEDPGSFRIGIPAAAAAVVTLPVYSMWSRAHLEDSLLTACTLMAAAGPDGTTAGAVADGFLRTAHTLLSVHAMYFDIARDTGREHRP